ncbi:MAG: histidine phosphatase family protein [Magnetococcales bacterium]|nr:histidine phosphatase family protein [Magnetococcales bacterium]
MKRPLVTTFDFLRHGEPKGGQKYRGTLDDPLSPHGWRQMQSSIDCHPAPWQRVITSPLVRCADFAEKTASARSIPLVVEANLREMAFGLWEGRTRQSLLDDPLYGSHIQNFWRNPLDNPPPEGEPIQRVQNRVAQGLRSLLQRFRGEHVLIVAHSGVIRIALATILGLPMQNISRMLVPYAALSRIKLEELRSSSSASQPNEPQAADNAMADPLAGRIDGIGDDVMPRLVFFNVGGLSE